MKYNEFILEYNLWGKTIGQFLQWLNEKSDKPWIFLDTETTGLHEDPYEVQLTQVSCIVVSYDFEKNIFVETDSFNKKIKLTDKTKDLIKSSTTRIKSVLSFNHYGKNDAEYSDEHQVLEDFYKFLSKYDDPMLVIQNAQFDMKFLNTRDKHIKFENEVMDTKDVIQLFYLPLIQKLAESDDYYESLIKKIGTSPRDNGLLSSSLSKIGPACGVNMSGYHDALVDCRLVIEVLENIFDLLKNNKGVDIRKYQSIRIKSIRSI